LGLPPTRPRRRAALRPALTLWRNGSRQTIQLPDDDNITLAGVVEELHQFRPFGLGTGSLLLIDPSAPGAFERYATLFNRAKRNHEQQFQQSRADPFAAIESVISWDAFTQSVTEAEKLSQPEDFDYLHRIGDSYSQVRRYAPALLEVLRLKAAPAARDILEAVETLKTLNADNTRKVPKDAPTSFVKKRWESLAFTADGTGGSMKMNLVRWRN
jgi:hypothetical protein